MEKNFLVSHERRKGKGVERKKDGEERRRCSGKTGGQFSWQFGLAVRQQRPVDSTNLSCLARLRSSPSTNPFDLDLLAPRLPFVSAISVGGLQETSRAMNINASMEKYYTVPLPFGGRRGGIFVSGNYRDPKTDVYRVCIDYRY